MVDDWLASFWAVYYLRDHPIWLGSYRLYIADASERMRSSRQPDLSDIRYVLTDDHNTFSEEGSGWQKVVHQSPYTLYRARSGTWGIITAIKNDNGLDKVDGKDFLWLGRGTTQLEVLANSSGTAFLAASSRLGPSLPGRDTRSVVVEGAESYRQTVTLGTGPVSIPVSMKEGRSIVRLTPLDTPTYTLPTDHRPLLLGLTDLHILPVVHGEQTLLFQVQNPYGEDRVNDTPWYWLTTEPTIIRFTTTRAGDVEVRAHFRPGPSVSGNRATRMVRVFTDGYKQDVRLEKPDAVIRFPAVAGANTVHLLPIDQPDLRRLPNGDTRRLVVGLSNVKLVQLAEASSPPCRQGPADTVPSMLQKKRAVAVGR
jgi:hypothetical protein